MASIDCIINLILSTIQAFTGFSTVGTTTTSRDDSRYYWSSLEILTTLFFFYFAWDSVFTENVYELWAFQIARALSSVYSVVQYFTVAVERTTFNLVQMILIVAFQVVFWATAFQLYRSFGWWAFRRLGADVQLKAMYKNYQLFLAQTKFDCQFGLMMVMMSVFFFAKDTTGFIALELVMFIFVFVYAYLGTSGIRAEDTRRMRYFFILGSITPLNIVIKALMMILLPHKFGRNAPYVQVGLTAGFALVNRITLLFNGRRALLNFHKGLKENAFDRKLDDADDMAAPFVDYVAYDAGAGGASGLVGVDL